MFKKYNSIENSYQQKFILRMLEQYPELKDAKYSIREKLDGSNLQLYFETNKQMRVGKRTSFLEEGDKFFDVWSTLKKYEPQVIKLQQYVDNYGCHCTVRVFAELYGSGVQKRINYGEEKSISFFDIEINDKMLSQKQFEQIMADLQIDNIAPLLKYVGSLKEALEYSPDFNSKVLGVENNPSEGIVIKPYEREYYSKVGSRFLLKKKADAFSEKMKVKPGKKRTDEVTKIVNAKIEFQSYINDNRVKSTFSKHGEIESPDQLGKYIQLVLADAKGDFLKEYNISDLDDKELKKIYGSGGKHIVALLKGYL
jgi:Rnl2 family RNA ligase